MGYLLFETLEAFHTAFAPSAEAIMGDIPIFTDGP